MGFSLDEVVPWGRSYDEYVRMFDLSEFDLGLRILGCGDGPAAFNAVLAGGGGTVLSVDPLYMFKVAQIEERIAATCEAVLAQLRGNQNDYVWREIRLRRRARNSPHGCHGNLSRRLRRGETARPVCRGGLTLPAVCGRRL